VDLFTQVPKRQRHQLASESKQTLPLTAIEILGLMAKNGIFQPKKTSNNVNGNTTKIIISFL
jgi:hypothetical protein